MPARLLQQSRHGSLSPQFLTDILEQFSRNSEFGVRVDCEFGVD
jgi:hypothetical protein